MARRPAPAKVLRVEAAPVEAAPLLVAVLEPEVVLLPEVLLPEVLELADEELELPLVVVLMVEEPLEEEEEVLLIDIDGVDDEKEAEVVDPPAEATVNWADWARMPWSWVCVLMRLNWKPWPGVTPETDFRSYDSAEVWTLLAMLMLTGGLMALLTSTMLKLLGSVETEAQTILLSLLRSRLEPWAGETTWRARVEATRARMEAAVSVNCILSVVCLEGNQMD